MYAIVGLAFSVLVVVLVKQQGIWALLLTPLGFVFGVFSSAQIILPVLMGLPRAFWLIAQSYMRASVCWRLLITLTLWLLALFFLGFLWPSAAKGIYNNTALDLGAILGMIAIALSPLSAKARSGFITDFNKAYEDLFTESGRAACLADDDRQTNSTATPQPNQNVKEVAAKVALIAFPGGEKQIVEETNQLHALLCGKLQKPEARRLLSTTKALLVMVEDKTESRIVPSIQSIANGKLTPHECRIVYQFLTGIVDRIHDDNDGSAREKAVIINATSSIVSIDAEYQWLSARFGKQEQDWTVEMRIVDEEEGHFYETFVLNLRNGTSRTVHFDVSSFYGRF